MPPLAVSMGDPAGVGLEIAARAWSERRERSLPDFFLIGDEGALGRAAKRIGVDVSSLPVRAAPLAVEERPGAPSAHNAQATIRAIELGVTAVRGGEAAALVTLPIAKHVLAEAGFGFPGHTEFVAHLTQDIAWTCTRGPVMMLAGPRLRVALATIHLPLKQVPAALSVAGLVQTARVVAEALTSDFGVARPRIALAGLNPHAGEAGGMGREDIEIINPAAAALRRDGFDVSDALPADTLFHDAARARHDAVIAMYHDQGLIPIKTLHFWDAVNVTLGLPLVRTSPDHGAGFDIAGRGVARIDSFCAALKMAHDMAARRAQQ